MTAKAIWINAGPAILRHLVRSDLYLARERLLAGTSAGVADAPSQWQEYVR